MTEEISRRVFLALAGAASVSPGAVLGPQEEVPPLLDHILLGCSDLQRGIDFVAEHTGVRAAFGGVHPNRGTRNALLSLGERRYLEIIAPDPKQPGSTAHYDLQKLAEPRLVGWAAHPGDLKKFAERLTREAIAFDGPTPGSRKRPDGRLLQWQTLNLKDDASGLLPFFIEWSAGSAHPSVDAPKGASLLRFTAASTAPEQLARLVAQLNLDLPVVKDNAPQLRAAITGAKGHLDVTS